VMSGSARSSGGSSASSSGWRSSEWQFCFNSVIAGVRSLLCRSSASSRDWRSNEWRLVLLTCSSNEAAQITLWGKYMRVMASCLDMPCAVCHQQ
jgi:hypothetical protein